jgi:hypothetical protein
MQDLGLSCPGCDLKSQIIGIQQQALEFNPKLALGGDEMVQDSEPK